jgi:hypothetical protein
MARRGGNRGRPYNFTARRRYALKRAQEISAKKRKSQRNKRIGVAAGAIAGIAVAGYLGSKHVGGIRKQNVAAVRKAVQPGNKEKHRVANAVSVAPPSATRTRGPITATDRQRAANTRKAMERAALPPHMGGPDRKRYTADDEINTTAMTNAGVRRTLRSARKKAATGDKAPSLKSTPGGGNKTYPPANPRSSRAAAQAWSDENWADALAFDTPTNKPISGGSTARSRPAPKRDPLHTLAKMRYDDSKLLGSGAAGAGDTDAFLRSAGTSRPAPNKRTIKRR